LNQETFKLSFPHSLISFPVLPFLSPFTIPLTLFFPSDGYGRLRIFSFVEPFVVFRFRGASRAFFQNLPASASLFTIIRPSSLPMSPLFPLPAAMVSFETCEFDFYHDLLYFCLAGLPPMLMDGFPVTPFFSRAFPPVRFRSDFARQALVRSGWPCSLLAFLVPGRRLPPILQIFPPFPPVPVLPPCSGSF